MDKVVKGIVLKAKDYKENDKLLTILTLEEGKIIVRARGVKKATSKLKAFCQVFCFGEFELVSGKPFFILAGVKMLDNFYALATDYDKFCVASVVPILLDKICVENEIYTGLFLSAVKTLSLVNVDVVDVHLPLSKFLLDTLFFEGVEFDFSSVSRDNNSKIFLDLDSGEFVNEGLNTNNFVEVSPAMLSGLKMIKDTNFDKLQTIKLNKTLLEKIYILLLKNVANRFEINYNLLKI